MNNDATNIPIDNTLSFGLTDIDKAVEFHIKEKLNLKVTQNDKLIDVPIMYGSPERWKNVRKDGVFRDKRNKIQAPIIMYRRTNINKNKSLMRNIDVTSPNVMMSFQKNYSNENTYNSFNVLTNNIKPKEFVNIVVPDYIDITYEFIIWTNYISQMNELVEIISYNDGSYWGDLTTHRFLVTMDSFSNSVELSDGADRLVRSNFDILLKGFIIPQNIQRKIQDTKSISVKNVIFSESIDTADVVVPQPSKYEQYEKNQTYEIPEVIEHTMLEEQPSIKQPSETPLPITDYESIKKSFYKYRNI